MRNIRLVAIMVAAALPLSAAHAKHDALCAPLRAFVDSVGPKDERILEFRTSWGSGFKGEPDALYAKRCDHHGYAPAKAARAPR